MSHFDVVELTQNIDVGLSEEEIRTELMIEEATLRLLDIRFEATGRKARLGKIRRLRAAIAAHRRCPVELWERMFEHCCDPDAPLDTEVETSEHPLFALMQVCSLWRQVALNAPKLWRNVRAQNDERGINLATQWFSRAASIPRSLTLVSSGGSLIAFQHLIAKYPFHSLDITFFTGENSEMIDFSQIPAESLLPLERLMLNVKHNNTDGSMLSSLSFVGHTLPNLRCLFVSERVEMPQFQVPVPFTSWSHLHDLHLYCPLQLTQCLSILKNSVGVEKCTMHVASSQAHQHDWVAYPAIILPTITALTLNFDDCSDVGYFVNLLNLPNLNSLTLGGEARVSFHRPISFTQETIERLVERSGIQYLEELRIRIPITSLHVGEVLQLLPFLRSLMVSEQGVLDGESAQSIARGELGPRLREFGLHQTIERFAVDRLLTMLESREKMCWEEANVSRIRHVSFGVRDAIAGKAEIEKRVDELKKLGVDVRVEWKRWA